VPTKSQFIRAKHVNLEFVLKPHLQADDATSLESELSKQLHASVRSSNLETSLRLLVQGADPNYVHHEKGSTMPLHVAAKFGQAAQVELLLVYGADINATDGNGNTAIDLAKQNQFGQIAERLAEASYEVTDRIIYFLCGRKPDHSVSLLKFEASRSDFNCGEFQSGQHLIIPEQSRVEINEHLKIARGKLQLIPNKMFEELVMDLYEEVDRREMETSKLNRRIIHSILILLSFSLVDVLTQPRRWRRPILAHKSPSLGDPQPRPPEARPLFTR
jgi:G protein-coupled receptor kinase interactor 2